MSSPLQFKIIRYYRVRYWIDTPVSRVTLKRGLEQVTNTLCKYLSLKHMSYLICVCHRGKWPNITNNVADEREWIYISTNKKFLSSPK